METLRGTKGASFEGPGTITRGGSPAVGCGGCFGGGGRFEPKQRFLLVKGQYCFVYAKESDPSPKYAVGLQGLRATKLKPTTSGVGRGGDGSAVTVRLENSLGDVQYEVALANEALARTFQAAVEKHAASAEVEAVRKNLGHEALVGKRSSVVYADAVGKEKVSAQPDAPLSATEIMANMPSPGQI